MFSKKKQAKAGQKAKFGDSFGGFVLAVLAILSFRWLLFEPFVIPSGSMIPTLLIHDHILVSKMAYGVRVPFSKNWLFRTGEPKRGDIVVFRSVEDSNYFMIKRVVGLPGETVEITDDGQVKINGTHMEVKPLTVSSDPASQKPYYAINEGDLQGSFSDYDFFEEKTGEKVHRTILQKGAARMFDRVYQVPADHYFVMGDNRDNSKDSRYWDSLPRENLLGRALFIWLSCEETLPFLPFLCNPLEVRGKRLFNALH